MFKHLYLKETVLPLVVSSGKSLVAPSHTKWSTRLNFSLISSSPVASWDFCWIFIKIAKSIKGLVALVDLWSSRCFGCFLMILSKSGSSKWTLEVLRTFKDKNLELCLRSHHVGQFYVAEPPKYAYIITTIPPILPKHYARQIHQNFEKIQLILEVLIWHSAIHDQSSSRILHDHIHATPPPPPCISRPLYGSVGQMQMKTLLNYICQPIFVFCHGFSNTRPYQYTASVFP